MNIPYLSGDSFFACFIELYVAEIERNVHGYFDKVEYIKEEAEVEDKACASKRGKLYQLARYAERIAEQKKKLEEKAFTLCCARYERFAYRNGPGKTEAKNCESFEKVGEHMQIHKKILRVLLDFCLR
jgi:hypothetical protein